MCPVGGGENLNKGEMLSRPFWAHAAADPNN